MTTTALSSPSPIPMAQVQTASAASAFDDSSRPMTPAQTSVSLAADVSTIHKLCSSPATLIPSLPRCKRCFAAHLAMKKRPVPARPHPIRREEPRLRACQSWAVPCPLWIIPAQGKLAEQVAMVWYSYLSHLLAVSCAVMLPLPLATDLSSNRMHCCWRWRLDAWLPRVPVGHFSVYL